MWSYFWGSKTNGQRIAPIAWSYCMKCSGMQLSKGGRKQNGSSAKAQLNTEVGVPAVQLVGQRWPKKSCLRYIWKYVSCIDCQDLLLESQQYLRKCCPPYQTTKGVRKKRPPHPQHDPMLKAPIPLGAMSPTEQGKMTQWREVWPWCVRPIKKHWPQYLPWKRK